MVGLEAWAGTDGTDGHNNSLMRSAAFVSFSFFFLFSFFLFFILLPPPSMAGVPFKHGTGRAASTADITYILAAVGGWPLAAHSLLVLDSNSSFAFDSQRACFFRFVFFAWFCLA